MKLSDREQAVLDVLWDTGGAELGEITQALQSQTGWSKKTVFTYLSRMEEKGLVKADAETYPRKYHAAVSREESLAEARQSFLRSVYHGAAGDLIAAFLKENRISPEERERLRRLLDDMEV